MLVMTTVLVQKLSQADAPQDTTAQSDASYQTQLLCQALTPSLLDGSVEKCRYAEYDGWIFVLVLAKFETFSRLHSSDSYQFASSSHNSPSLFAYHCPPAMALGPTSTVESRFETISTCHLEDVRNRSGRLSLGSPQMLTAIVPELVPLKGVLHSHRANVNLPSFSSSQRVSALQGFVYVPRGNLGITRTPYPRDMRSRSSG